MDNGANFKREVFCNCRMIGSVGTLADVWIMLHHDAYILANNSGTGAARGNTESVDLYDQRVLKMLVDVSLQEWEKLCTAAGWTAYGAVALSWCEGATLPQVFDSWRASGFPLKPLPEYERPARFINPALLPRTRKLSELAAAAEPDILGLCAMIAHSPEPLEFDVPHPSLRGSPNPQIVAFLKSRMLQKPSRTQEEDDLIAAWSETVKGSEFDVWKGT